MTADARARWIEALAEALWKECERADREDPIVLPMDQDEAETEVRKALARYSALAAEWAEKLAMVTGNDMASLIGPVKASVQRLPWDAALTAMEKRQ